MLGDRIGLKLTFNKKEYELNVNFKFLKNLDQLLKINNADINAIEYIEKFFSNENKDSYYIDFIYCMCDGKIEFNDLIELVKELDESFFIQLAYYISLEMNMEDIFIKEQEEEEYNNKEESEIDTFLSYWDRNYYIATIQLNYSYNKFLNSSPREITTLGKLHEDFYKNIILKRDIEIAKAKNNANKEEEKEVKVTRLRDLFTK